RRVLFRSLLDEDEAPELILEPIEVLLSTLFCPVIGPAGALEWIETQVRDVWDVNVGLLTEPALGLVDEAIFVIVDADGADRAFAEIEDLMTGGGAFAADGIQLVVAVQMVFVGP